MELDVQQGQVWWARPDPSVVREQAGRRPVIIVSGHLYNETVTTLALAAPITTRDRGWGNHVPVRGAHGLPDASWIMTEQVRAISRERLVGPAGRVDPGCMREVLMWVGDYLRN